MTPSQVCWDLSLAGAVTYGWLGGGKPERIAAIAFLVAGLLDVATYTGVWHHLQRASLSIDLILLIILLQLALRSDRFWPLWAASFRIIAVTARLAPVLDPVTRAYAAYVGVIGWDYLTLAALVLGVRLEVGETISRMRT